MLVAPHGLPKDQQSSFQHDAVAQNTTQFEDRVMQQDDQTSVAEILHSFTAECSDLSKQPMDTNSDFHNSWIADPRLLPASPGRWRQRELMSKALKRRDALMRNKYRQR